MRCDNDSGKRLVRHVHGNVNKAERAATEMTGMVMLCVHWHDLSLHGSAHVFVSADCGAVCQHKQCF